MWKLMYYKPDGHAFTSCSTLVWKNDLLIHLQMGRIEDLVVIHYS